MNSGYGRADQYGGRSRHIVDYGNAKIPVTIFSRTNSNERPDDAITVNTVSLPLRYNAKRYTMAVLRQSAPKKRAIGGGFDRALARKIARFDLKDVAVLHTWEWIPETLRAVKRLNPKIKIVRDVVVNRYHEFYSGTPIVREDELTDIFLSPSSFSTRCLKEWGIPVDKIVEIPFGVDSDLFRPETGREKSPVRFAFTGAISKRKGVDTLLRVWKKLDLHDGELHLYGKLRSDARSALQGAKNVRRYGHVPLYDELPKNHIYVFPSTLEGSAKSVYEALACGLPVITTPNSGSIVRDGVDGCIVKAGDEAMLADAMARLYRDESMRTTMGASARARAEGFTWRRYAHSVWDAYAALDARISVT